MSFEPNVGQVGDASQQFVALLSSEQRTAGEPPNGWPFVCEYLGPVALAKNFGTLPVYHVRDRRRPALAGA